MANTGWNNQLVPLVIISASGGFTGLFVYSPVPGAGNLVTSIASAAGTDPYGNAFPAGITEGKVGKIQVQLFADPVSGIGKEQFLLANSLFTNPELVASVTGAPAFADIAIIGPASTVAGFTDQITVTFNSSDAISSSANITSFYTSVAGPVFTYFTMDASGFNIRACNQLTATMPGTGTPATPAQSETWHDLRPLTNSFIGTNAGFYPPQYRKLADGNVQVWGSVKTPPTTGNYNGVIFANIAAGWRPLSNDGALWPVTRVADGLATPLVHVDTSGNMSFSFLPTSLAQTTIGIGGIYPLDNTGTILT